MGHRSAGFCACKVPLVQARSHYYDNHNTNVMRAIMARTSFMQGYLGPDTPQREGAEPVVHRRGQTYLARCLHQITLGAMSSALEGSGLVSMHWGVVRAIQLEPGI